MNFLHENFLNPVPISKGNLFHLDERSVTESHTTPIQTTCILSPQIPVSGATRVSTTMPVYSNVEGNIIRPGPNQPPLINGHSNVNPMLSTPTEGGAVTTTMNYINGPTEIYSSGVSSLSRVQEKEELQRLNDRFSAYVNRVRMLSQQAHSVDTSAFLKSSKILEEEIVNMKTIYEAELEKLRREIEVSSHEKHSLSSQNNKNQVFVGELQDRLSIETDRTQKLLEEINLYQRKISGLEGQMQDFQIAMQRPNEDMDQLSRNIENLRREVEQWKHRYEHEQVARQEAEGKIQQMFQKVDLADQIHGQQISDYQARMDTTSASILSLEAKVRDLSTVDVSVSEMLKHVRESAETELRKFQIESEEQYSRNLTVLKAQIDNDADSLHRFQTEKSQLTGSIGELHAKIRNLEGQVVNLQHQKQTLEDAVSVERNRSADNIQQLERKLREVQDLLIVKMKEVTNARDSNIPLKAEIEALKILMEEEEKRLRVPLGIVPASVIQTTVTPTLTTAQIVAASQPATHIIRATSETNQRFNPMPPSAYPITQTFPSSGTQQQEAMIGASSAQLGSLQNTTALPPVTPSAQYQLVSTASGMPIQGFPTAGTVTAAGNTTTSAQSTFEQEGNYNYSSNMQSSSGLTNPHYPYVPSPPLDTLYVPEALQLTDEDMLAYDAPYGTGYGDYDLYMQGFSLPMTGPRYHYETTPSVNRLQIEQRSPSPRPVGPIPARVKSAPAHADMRTGVAAETQNGQTSADAAKCRNLHLIPSNLGSGRDYFDEMFNNLQQSTLYSKSRPKSSPVEARMSSTAHDYTVSTSSAIGDLKILEVNQDGKFVRLVNDGPTEFEFGGYMIQQNVGGHPVAVYRFPPRSKFPPDSTISVWSAMNDPTLHNPPTDFFWREQHKFGTGPECTTILCRANGQAVAWTTAAHRFTKDNFKDFSKKDERMSSEKVEDFVDNESLTEFTQDTNGPKSGSVYLRREKEQPRSLLAPKHPHGNSPCMPVHPQVGQARSLHYGNDNSSYNRQSRIQTTRSDPIPGQHYAGASAQRMGSAPLKKLACCTQGSQPTIRGNGCLANKPIISGTTCEGPNPFMRPHSRLGSGLNQISSQHNPDFLPPMPFPLQAS